MKYKYYEHTFNTWTFFRIWTPSSLSSLAKVLWIMNKCRNCWNFYMRCFANAKDPRTLPKSWLNFWELTPLKMPAKPVKKLIGMTHEFYYFHFIVLCAGIFKFCSKIMRHFSCLKFLLNYFVICSTISNRKLKKTS